MAASGLLAKSTASGSAFIQRSPSAARVRKILGAGDGGRSHHKARRSAGAAGASPAAFSPAGLADDQIVDLGDVARVPQALMPGVEMSVAWFQPGERRRLAPSEPRSRVLRQCYQQFAYCWMKAVTGRYIDADSRRRTRRLCL